MAKRRLVVERMTTPQLWKTAMGLMVELEYQTDNIEPIGRRLSTMAHLKDCLRELYLRGVQGNLF